MTTPNELADRIDALGKYGDNALDVLVEIALFIPNKVYSGIRANSAGTKVIYTDPAMNEVTCWAQDWTTAKSRAGTIKALRAKGTDHG